MKVLVVTAHPRGDSLTASVTKNFIEGLAKAGHEYEVIDLYAEEFMPLVFPLDEPDWDNPDKTYSETVMREQQRIKDHDALVYTFPVWWYSMPAVLKGYIDRVWNYGFAYGPAKLPVKKVQWIALASFTEEQFQKRDYDRMMEHYLNIGLAEYCGVDDSNVHFVYNSQGKFDSVNEVKEHYSRIFDGVYQLGTSFGSLEHNVSTQKNLAS